MFRLSHYVRDLFDADTPRGAAPARSPAAGGPVVIWNLTRRCNLTCKHCYSTSTDIAFQNELSTAEILRVMEDLRAFGVSVLILSGGEPLLRPDLFVIAGHARQLGFYVGLSTNGTLIDTAMAERIAEARFDYVGISIDGIGPVHDKFRRREGAYDASMQAIRFCMAAGAKVGLRFTMTQDNEEQLPAMIDLARREGIPKFYFSHLNYAGRGNHNRRDDSHHQMTRKALLRLFLAASEDHLAGDRREYVTGNNDADGPYFLRWVEENHPLAAERIERRLRAWGGNSSGVNIANIDNVGAVHPDTMWWHHTLGNVRDRPFSDIWGDSSHPLLAALRQKPRQVGGRCGGCRYLDICNGNTRVRAEQVSGDLWAEDPGCYLDDDEIGGAVSRSVFKTSFSERRRSG